MKIKGFLKDVTGASRVTKARLNAFANASSAPEKTDPIAEVVKQWHPGKLDLVVTDVRDACKTVCDTFKHSPVFRIGGDEFAVIAQGRDYMCIEELLEKMGDYNADAYRSGGILIACGMARFEEDESVAAVFNRADRSMYENKKMLKALQ